MWWSVAHRSVAQASQPVRLAGVPPAGSSVAEATAADPAARIAAGRTGWEACATTLPAPPSARRRKPHSWTRNKSRPYDRKAGECFRLSVDRDNAVGTVPDAIQRIDGVYSLFLIFFLSS